MAFIRKRRQWDSQPQEAVELDGLGEFFQNLVVAVPFNPSLPLADMVSGAPVAATGLKGRVITGDGVYHSFGASNYADLSHPPQITSGSQPVTIAWTQQPVSSSGYSTILNWKVPGASFAFLIYQSVSDASYYFSVGPRQTGSNAINFAASVGAVSNDRLDQYMLVCSGGVGSNNASDYSLYRNGELFTSAVNTAFAGNSTPSFRVGALDSGGDPFEGAIGDLLIWDEAFTAEKAIRYQCSRWSVYAPQSIWVPVSAGAGPTYTLTADGGAYTHTGGTAGLVAGRKIVASGGSYTHTGGTAGLLAGRKLAASGGDFTETGGTAGLVVGRKLVADGGAYAFTGGDANLVYTPVGGATYTLSASGGTFALTGGDVAFLAARKLVVDCGAFALSGGDAAFTYPYDTAVPSKVGGDDVPRIEIYEKRKKKKRKDETLEAVIRNAMRGEPVEVKADTRQIEAELLALQIEQENEDLLALIL